MFSFVMCAHVCANMHTCVGLSCKYECFMHMYDVNIHMYAVKKLFVANMGVFCVCEMAHAKYFFCVFFRTVQFQLAHISMTCMLRHSVVTYI